MTLSFDESIEFYRDEIEDCIQNYSKETNANLLALNFSCAFEYQLIIAMMYLKTGNNKAKDELRQVMNITQSAYAILLKSYPDVFINNFLVCEAAYVELLNECSISQVTLQQLKRLSCDNHHISRRVDALLLLYLFEQCSLEKLKTEINDSRMICSKLFSETYYLYALLVDSAKNNNLKEYLINHKKTVSIYKERPKDPFFVGGREIEGGMDPQDYIDYRLHAIVKYLHQKYKMVLPQG